MTSSAKKQTITGDLFIVPNALLHTLATFMGASIQVLAVQAWAVNKGLITDHGANWADHKPDFLETSFPKYFPISLFEGKKEGDTIEIEHDGKTIILTLNQLGHRYCRFGRFENCLAKLLKNHEEDKEHSKRLETLGSKT